MAMVAVVWLAGSVGRAQVPPDGMPFIQTSSGNGVFGGFVQRSVYADHSFVTQSAQAGGRNPKTIFAQGRPGLFLRLRDLVIAEGPGVRVTATGAANLCMDYGQDWVTAQPAVGEFTSVSASCPEPAMQAFYQRVFDAMAAP